MASGPFTHPARSSDRRALNRYRRPLEPKTDFGPVIRYPNDLNRVKSPRNAGESWLRKLLLNCYQLRLKCYQTATEVLPAHQRVAAASESAAAKRKSMSLHANKRLWQKHVLAENRRSIEGLLATLSPEPLYVIMATGQEHRGRAGVAAFYSGLFESMPDVTFDLQEVFIGESGVVEESVMVGTHTGDLFGLPPTGQPIRLPLTIVFPMRAGAILGERLYFDMDSLQRQLGLRA